LLGCFFFKLPKFLDRAVSKFKAPSDFIASKMHGFLDILQDFWKDIITA
jgi:hypothetical protein